MKFALLLALLPSCFSVGQNLVANAGFEEFYTCPGSFTINPLSREIAPRWSSPTAGTPDLFNECSKGAANASHNWAGVSSYHAGKGYVGIYVWMKGQRSYREYIQAKLKYPLIEGREYLLEFSFKFSSYSRYSIDRIGALLLDSAYHSDKDTPIPISPTISKVYDSAFRGATGLWEKVSSQFIAKGNEQYVIVGNFANNQSTKSFHVNFEPVLEPMLANACYYYIDDVSVADVDSIRALPKVLVADKNVKLNETYVLQNIQFEYNKATLQSASFTELEKLVSVLKENSGWKVTLAGHTDDVGSLDFNQQLSETRAASVAAFLITRGIDKSRITSIGFGKQMPLERVNSEVAKAKNRRVEYTFSMPAHAIK